MAGGAEAEGSATQAEALATAVTPSTHLATLAAEKGLTVQSGVTLGRTPEQGQSFPPALVSKLFATKPGEAVFVADGSGGYAAQLKEVQVPQTIPEDEAEKLTTQITGAMRPDVAGEFTQGLRRRYPVADQRDELTACSEPVLSVGGAHKIGAQRSMAEPAAIPSLNKR